MRGMFKAFAKRLLGANYEGLKRMLLICPAVFWGLHTAGLRVPVRPTVLYLTVSFFTAGVMWRALSAKDNAAYLENLFMLPFERAQLTFSYISALGVYTLFTKTAVLLAVVLAVSSWGGAEFFGCLLCAANAVLVTACVYSRKKRRGAGLVWAGAAVAGVLWLGDSALFLPAAAGNALLAGLLLPGADPYSFYRQGSGRAPAAKSSGCPSAGRYLFRYWLAHKSCWLNTAAMWVVACALPAFLGQVEGAFGMTAGFAILTLNTPLGILLSCDPDLEQAIRFLPGQKRAFCLPYGQFIFLWNTAADAVFLGSWQIQRGGVTGGMALAAVFFALQSAVASVLLEWFCPIRGWRIENDLWHHPRKYIVPAAMLLMAAAAGAAPAVLPVLLLLLAIEIIVILLQCGRD